jgi:hypothetical protein
MKTGTLGKNGKLRTLAFARNKTIPGFAYVVILCLLLFFSGANMLKAGTVHEQFINSSPTTYTEVVSPTYFSNPPTGRPLKGEIEKDLSDLVQLAREMVGRIDMTSVSGGILEETQDQKSSNSSLKLMDDCFLLSGQNTKQVAPPNDVEDEPHPAFAIRHDKWITKDSPADKPLSFTWQYIQTKK